MRDVARAYAQEKYATTPLVHGWERIDSQETWNKSMRVILDRAARRLRVGAEVKERAYRLLQEIQHQQTEQAIRLKCNHRGTLVAALLFIAAEEYKYNMTKTMVANALDISTPSLRRTFNEVRRCVS